MNRPDHNFTHRWHVAINQFMFHSDDPKWTRDYSKHRWLYEAKAAADEVPRLMLLFKLERTGGLKQTHQQCSHAEPVPVLKNELMCCLGVKCAECEPLHGVAKMEGTPEEIDEAKAWTCVAHVLSQGGDLAAEGYILTTDDRMYWNNVYQSLATPNPDEVTTGKYACGYCGSNLEVNGEIAHERYCQAPQPTAEETPDE